MNTKKRISGAAHICFLLGLFGGVLVALTYKIVEWLLLYTPLAFIIGGLIIVLWEVPLLIIMEKIVYMAINYKEEKQ